MSTSEVDDVLMGLQDDLNKTFGDGSVMRLDSGTVLSNVASWVSTRNMIIDSVLRGGRPVGSSLIPFGRQMEISGLENSGKTTLCAQIAAETQAQGGIVMVTDAEERIAEDYWTSLGVDTSRVIHISATSIEDVFNKQYAALRKAKERAGGRKILMLWDSLGGTSIADLVDPKSKESPMDQASQAYGRNAAEISTGMRLINDVIAHTCACYLYTNHMYTKMNVKFGDPYETYGGQKPKYYATVRLRLQAIGGVAEADSLSADPTKNKKLIGQRIKIKALKNQMSGVLLTREAVLMAGKGFSDEYSAFEVGVKTGVIAKNGGWSTWTTPKGDQVKFQGWGGFEEKVVPHPEYSELHAAVLAAL